MWKPSLGLCNHVGGVGSYYDALNNCLIKIYSGPAPASANDAVPASATLLCTISDNNTGGGLNFKPAVTDGVLSKLPSQIWSGVEVANGVASWFRVVKVDDVGNESTTAIRLQGDVSQVAGDMTLYDTSFAVGNHRPIKHCNIIIPQ